MRPRSPAGPGRPHQPAEGAENPAVAMRQPRRRHSAEPRFRAPAAARRWSYRKELAMKLIVHGTDGSPEAEEALNLAIELAKDAGAKLAVVSVHVIHAGGKGISPPVTEVEQPHGAEHLAETAAATARAAGLEAKAYAVSGEPAREI